jgi:hypothetical protein
LQLSYVAEKLVALTVYLAISYIAIPQLSAVTWFIISSSSLASGAEVVRSLDTLDRRSVVATYAEIMNSSHILEIATNRSFSTIIEAMINTPHRNMLGGRFILYIPCPLVRFIQGSLF